MGNVCRVESLWSMDCREKRRLVIPAGLGYGNRGAGDLIPAGRVHECCVETRSYFSIRCGAYRHSREG